MAGSGSYDCAPEGGMTTPDKIHSEARKRHRKALLVCQLAEQGFADASLVLGSELRFVRGEVENVDGRLPFRVDDGNLDVAFLARENRTDLVQKSGLVLRDHFDERALRRAVVVEDR